MAITVQCTGCKRSISLDDGFAGGAWRCPYCKEINMVSSRGANGGGRPLSPIPMPAAPTLRPESPGEAEPEQPPQWQDEPAGEQQHDVAVPASPEAQSTSTRRRLSPALLVGLILLVVLIAAAAIIMFTN